MALSGPSSYYDGSKIFVWLGDYIGLSVDQVFNYRLFFNVRFSSY